MPFRDDVLTRLDADAAVIIAKYPRPRSALLPLLHLVQSEEGYVSADGIEYCAAKFGLSEAEVTAVVSTTSACAPTRCARSWAATRSSPSSASTSA
jgi:NADH-quinone oxidoreductase subunit E